MLGEDIINAVKKIAQEPIVIDCGDESVVGQCSENLYECIVVFVDGETRINPGKDYQNVTVGYYPWNMKPNTVYCYEKNQEIEAIQNFQERLENVLNG